LDRVSPKRAAIATLLAVSLLLALGSVLFACGSADVSGQPDLTLDGKPVDLSVYKGKPLFLVFMEST
jgi:hypothetical protein